MALTSELLDLCIYVFSYNPKHELCWFVTLFVPPKLQEAVYTKGKCHHTRSYSKKQLERAVFPCPANYGQHEPIFLLLKDQHYQPLKLLKPRDKGASPLPDNKKAPLLQKQPSSLSSSLLKNVQFTARHPPLKTPSTETKRFLQRYLEIVEEQLQLADEFLKKNNVKDQDLLTQYRNITDEWEKVAQRLQKSL
ncbi:hypothetical protein EBX93_15185 [bacterium]|nr:hypothetical protein [bacterium]